MRGGRLLGQGASGCVFSPGFQCTAQGSSRNTLLSRKEKTVSKIQIYDDDAKNEERMGKKLRDISNANSHFQVLESVCPVTIEQLKDDDIDKCELPSLTTSKLVMLTFPFIQGTHPIQWLRKKNQPLVHLEKFIKNLCTSLTILADHSIVHHDLKNDNILVKPSNKPILLDFGLAVDMSAPTYHQSFFYAPDYEIWAPEIHLINEVVTEDKINEIIFYALRPLSLFLEKEFLEKYRVVLHTSLTRLKGLSEEKKRANIKTYWDTWDVYSLAYLLLECLLLLRSEGHVEETERYQRLLEWGLRGIHPLRRVNAREWRSLIK